MAIGRGLKKLKFSKKILSTVEDSIPTKDLIENLSELHHELSNMDQDETDLSSLTEVKEHLIQKKLVKHKNPGVQVYVSCCLSDILRIYAPDAPYNASQLSDLFKLFFRQFQYLNDTENGYYQQYIYLLTRLAEVRSIVLITDLPNSDKLIESLFQICYDLSMNSGSKKSHGSEDTSTFATKLEPLLCDILSEVITESPSIPVRTLKLILNRFLANTKVMKSNLNTKNITYVPGFNFSLNICTMNPDRMARLVTQVFSEAIYEGEKEDQESYEDEDGAGNNDYSEDSEDEETNGKSREPRLRSSNENTLGQLKKLHTLSVELWKYVPEVLASVMGLTEDELDAEDDRIRAAATESVGQMLALQPSKLDFVNVHRSTYNTWMKKPLDKSPLVRIAWIKTTSKILRARSDITSDLVNRISKTLVDSDERARLITCKELASIPADIFVSKIANTTLMSTLAQLTRERNSEIRSSNLDLLGNLYDASFDQLYKGDAKVDKLIDWIPETIFNLIYINDKNINSQVDHIIIEKIFAYSSSSSTERANRLLKVVEHLGEKASRAFVSIVKRQQAYSNTLSQALKIASAYDGGNCENPASLRAKIENAVTWFANSMPSDSNCDECLKQFFILNNKRFFKLAQTCSSSEADYKTMKSCIQELTSRLQDPKNYKIKNGIVPFTSMEMVNTIKLLLYRSSVFIFNKDNIPEILKISRDDSNSSSKTAKRVLEQISSIVPGVLKSNISQIIGSILSYSLPSNLSKDLKTVYHFIKNFTDYQIVDDKDLSKLNENLKKLVLNGTPSESKYAIRILNSTNLQQDVFEGIMDKIWPLDSDSEKFNTHLTIISELFKIYPQIMEEKASALNSLLASEVLLHNKTVGRSNDEGTDVDDLENVDTWISDEALETELYKNCYSKILALRVYVNWLISVKDDPNHETTAEPIFKLLSALVNSGGELLPASSPTWPTPRDYQARLRLEAGLKLLKLAKYPEYNILIQPLLINKLILLIQDESQNVRMLFCNKLKKYLTLNIISERFLPLFFFFAHEPNLEFKNDCRTWVRSMFAKHKLEVSQTEAADSSADIKYEKSFLRFLHMLAHHQELNELVDQSQSSGDNDKAILKVCDFALTYITFALDLIATAENCSLIFYLSGRIKQYHDSITPEKSDRLYIVSDLAQLKIKSLTSARNWNLATWPYKLSLTVDLFKSIKNAKELHEIATYSYVPESLHKEVMDLIKEHNKNITQDEASLKKKLAIRTPLVAIGLGNEIVSPAAQMSTVSGKAKTKTQFSKTKTKSVSAPKPTDNITKTSKGKATSSRRGRHSKSKSYSSDDDEESEDDEHDDDDDENSLNTNDASAYDASAYSPDTSVHEYENPLASTRSRRQIKRVRYGE